MITDQDRFEKVIEDIVADRVNEHDDRHIRELYEEYQHGDAATHLKRLESYDPDQAYDSFINTIKTRLRAKKHRKMAITYSLIVIMPRILTSSEMSWKNTSIITTTNASRAN